MHTQSPAAQEHASQLVTRDRAGFGDVLAQLRERAHDLDLVDLWDELPPPDRRLLLRSAGVESDAGRDAIHALNATERDAIRAAIHRMSRYASRLRGQLHGAPAHPSAELASHARQALAEGNTDAARHWLSLIERGIAQ